ncbi:hypothetical protein LCGC14_2584150, partial [marine sediment metagenome]
DPDGLGEIAMGELVSEFGAVVDVVPSFALDVDLPLTVYIGDRVEWPSFSTGFEMHWRPLTDMDIIWGPLAGGSHDIIDAFDTPVIQLGKVIGQVVYPVLAGVNKYYPIPEDVLELLNTEVPFLGMTIADYLDIPEPVQFLFLQIPQMLNRIEALLGGIQGTSSDSWSAVLNDLENKYDLTFPILDPSTLIQLMMGQDVDLVLWDPDKFEISTGFNFKVPVFSYGVPALASINISIYVEGNFGLFADIAMGFDTSGIREFFESERRAQDIPLILNGFWLGDNHRDGTDQTEMGVFAEIIAGINGSVTVLGFDVAELFGGIGIRGELGLNINDYDLGTGALLKGTLASGQAGDGKVHINELEAIVQDFGAACLFNLEGLVSLIFEIGFRIDLWFFEIEKSWRTYIPLVDFTIECDADEPLAMATLVGGDLVMEGPGSITAPLFVPMPGSPEIVEANTDAANRYDIKYVEAQD